MYSLGIFVVIFYASLREFVCVCDGIVFGNVKFFRRADMIQLHFVKFFVLLYQWMAFDEVQQQATETQGFSEEKNSAHIWMTLNMGKGIA